jgi:hypothetical protein
MGGCQREQPLLHEESIGPALMIAPPASLSRATPRLVGLPLIPGLGFASPYQARQSPPAESSLLSYGLISHPLLCSHPASRRRSCSRVTGRRAYSWRGLSPLWSSTPSCAPGAALCGRPQDGQARRVAPTIGAHFGVNLTAKRLRRASFPGPAGQGHKPH